MPYTKSPRPYKHEWDMEKKRDEKDERATRARARYALDKKGIKRKGKDVAHKVPLSRGGTNEDGYTLQSPSQNRSYPRTASGGVKMVKKVKRR